MVVFEDVTAEREERDSKRKVVVDADALARLRGEDHHRRDPRSQQRRVEQEGSEGGRDDGENQEASSAAGEDVFVFVSSQREAGNALFRQGDHAMADEAYGKGLAAAREAIASGRGAHGMGNDDWVELHTVAATMLSNRAAARLALQRYDGAREDSEAAVAAMLFGAAFGDTPIPWLHPSELSSRVLALPLEKRKRIGKALYRFAIASYRCGTGDVGLAMKALKQARGSLGVGEANDGDGGMLDSIDAAEGRFTSTTVAIAMQKKAAAILEGESGDSKGQEPLTVMTRMLAVMRGSPAAREAPSAGGGSLSQDCVVCLEAVLRELEEQPLCRAHFWATASDGADGFQTMMRCCFEIHPQQTRRAISVAVERPGRPPPRILDELALLVRRHKLLTESGREELVRLVADLSRDVDFACAIVAPLPAGSDDTCDANNPSMLEVVLKDIVFDEESLKRLSVAAAEAVVVLLFRLGSHTESRTCLASVSGGVIDALLTLHEAAEGLHGVENVEFDIASVHEAFGESTTERDILTAFNDERNRVFRPKIFQFRRRCMMTLSVLVRDAALVRAAFSESAQRALRYHVSIVDLMTGILGSLDAQSPKKLAPMLAPDGSPSEYVKRPYAADYIDNDAGDALANLPDELAKSFKTLLSTREEEWDDGVRWEGPEGVDVASMRNKALLEIAISCCSLLCSHASIAAVFAKANIHALLALGRNFSTYATESIRAGSEELLSKVTGASRAATKAALDDGCIALKRGVALSVMRSPASGIRGLDELLKDVATMSGDDFGDLCRRDGVLHVAIKVIQRGNGANTKVVHACEELFLQCMDRTRRFTHKDGKEAGALAAVGAREVESLEAALKSKRSPPPATLEAMEREKLRQAVSKPKTDKHKRPIYYGEDHVSKVPQVRSDGTGREATVCPNPRDATACPPEYDEDGVRVVMDSSATGDVRAARAAWVNKPLREKLRWTQNSTDITAWVLVPEYTKRKEISVQVTPTRLTVKLSWHGRVLDGPLRRRCKAGESCWILEEDTHEVQIMLPKDDAQFWRSLFEGGEEKSYYEVLQEMVNANDDDAMPSSYEELPERSKDLIEEIRERQELISEGLLDPEGLDDFRCVLGDGDGAK